MKKLILITLVLVSSLAQSRDLQDRYDFWPRIPFNIVGANLCEFESAYSQTRSEYIGEMVGHAEKLLLAGDTDPVKTLQAFNEMYQKNLKYARKGLGVTLENTFKSYLDQFYRSINPRQKRLEFKYVQPVDQVINAAISGGQAARISRSDAAKVDLLAYGTYSMSPNCNGQVVVTLTIINKDGYTKDYIAQGRAHQVMSNIATQVFDDYQRTKFPSKIKLPRKTLQLLGGLNGSIDTARFLREAQMSCESMDARLPTEYEYKMLNAYGTYSGGVSLGGRGVLWAMSGDYVFVPEYQRNPVRDVSSMGRTSSYKYICVR
ncbi:MAG: hypothetical protein KC478_09255 [Bacteriovoracaceae bacterium]|nr:hypothetical protein [Bacteriovoracaceae bacterium]